MASNLAGHGKAKGGRRGGARVVASLLFLAGLSALVLASSNASPSAASHDTDLTNAIAVEASSGWQYSCALIQDGTVRCWGDNGKAGLGDNTTIPYARAPVEVCETGAWAVAANGCLDGQAVSTLGNVTAIAVGGDHTCALNTAGGVKCWGLNSLGELGDGFACGSLLCRTPTQVTGLTSGVVAISAGLSHTCALVEVEPPATGFGATCWGYNHFAQLGDGHVCGTHICPTPVQVTGLESGVAQISAGSLHTCAILVAAGELQCWGLNAGGQLGDGTTALFRTTPVNVCPTGAVPPCLVALQGASNVAAGGLAHTCAAFAPGGGVKCWGTNGSGQLGDGTTTPSLLPVDVCAAGAQAPCGATILSDASAAAVGNFHSCALLADGTATCWGANAAGQLGDGLPGPASSTPVTVCDSAGGGCTALAGIQQLSAGSTHNCVLISGGSVKCWGENDRGELGDNTKSSRSVPVPVTLDTDRDGCADADEEQTATASEYSGGRRDPLYHWDFWDVWTPETDPSTPETLRRDQAVTIIQDVLAVAARFGPDDGLDGIDEFSDPLSLPPPAPAYHPAFDRGGQFGANAWEQLPPDGAINLPDDILGTAAQYGHDCGEPVAPPPPTPTPPPGAVTVAVGEFWFCDPSYQSGVCETTIDAGESVVWNFDLAVAPHTSTDCGADCDAPTGSPIWDSGVLTGGTFARTFETPGTFLYFCTIHPDTMRGRVVVNPPPPTPTPTPIP